MTREEYHELLKRKYAQTNFDDLENIKEYNRYARMLRKYIKED